MKIIVERKKLSDAVQNILPIVPPRATLPSLGNLVMEASKGVVRIGATDLEVYVRCAVQATVEKDGSTTIPAKKFGELLKQLTGEKVEMETDAKQQTVIRCGTNRTTMQGLPRTDYPVVPQFPSDRAFEFPRKMLIEMIEKTVYAVSVEDTRYVLTGVCLSLEKGKARMVATDGRRLSYIARPVADSAKVVDKVVIPAKAAREAARVLGDAAGDTVQVAITENQVGFRSGETLLMSRLIDGNFPNYEQVIPKSTTVKLTVKTADFAALTRKLQVVTTDKSNSIRFEFGTGKLAASAQGSGQGEDEMVLEYQGENVVVGFNPGYVLEALGHINGDMEIALSGPTNPAVFRPADDPDYLNVIMPMRL